MILFFLYLGYIELTRAFDDAQRGLRAGAILVMVGAVNLPIIKFSVDWWNTLHQPDSILRSGGPAVDPSMLKPLFIMAGAYLFLFLTLAFVRIETEILRPQDCPGTDARRMNDFLHMGGYAVYVWPAYALAAFGLIGLTMISVRALLKARRAHAATFGKR